MKVNIVLGKPLLISAVFDCERNLMVIGRGYPLLINDCVKVNTVLSGV